MQQHKNRDEKLWKLTKGYKQEYTPDVEKGLANLKTRIAKDQPTLVISMKIWLMRAASIAIVVLGSVVLYQNYTVSDNPSNVLYQTNDAVTSAAYHLPDGSQIWLNKHSKISYPPTFANTERVIQLEGEAYLDIESHPNKPFIIKTEETVIEVLGTAFNVRAYSSESQVSVSVEEGSVSFASPNAGKKIILQANDKGTYQKNEQDLVKTTAKEVVDLGWKEKQLSFKDTPISEILSYMTSQFNVEFISAENFSNCGLNATLVVNNPESILKRITSSFPIEAKPMGTNKYQLSGSCE